MQSRIYIDLVVVSDGGRYFVEAKAGHGSEGRIRFGPFDTDAEASEKLADLQAARHPQFADTHDRNGHPNGVPY